MASLLTEQNQRVEFVAMIDTFPWFPSSRTVSTRLAAMHMDRNFESWLVQVCEREGHHGNSYQLSLFSDSITNPEFTNFSYSYIPINLEPKARLSTKILYLA